MESLRFVSVIASLIVGLLLPSGAEGQGKPGSLAWLVVGGGAMPSMNQVSLEEDVLLAHRVLAGRGHMLFAGGKDSHGVQVENPGIRKQDLAQVLGEIFSPRPGRNARYRRTRVPAHGSATRTELLHGLSRALGRGVEPLFFFASAHGEIADNPADNYLALWGNDRFSPRDFTELMDASESSRSVLAVVTACFSGGFAEMVFQGAEPALGMGRKNRCGLFAAPWNEVSSGCDPDPNRQHHEGYALIFLNALRSQSRLGTPLPKAEIDVDGVEGVSPLEAHSYVRVVSTAVDIPTTTSERWLRFAAPHEGPWVPVHLPEEELVVRGLSMRLGIGGMEHRAREQMAILEFQRGQAEVEMEAAQDAEYEAYRILASELLGRWPVLDDPWHPDYAKVMEQEASTITLYLRGSRAYLRFLGALHTSQIAAAYLDELMQRRAPYARLVRAIDTLDLAKGLKAVGGEDWEYYLALRACERQTPKLRVPGKSK